VIPVVVGSSPIVHPNFKAVPGPLAQLVEQLTLNQLVVGSNPTRPTSYRRTRSDAGPFFIHGTKNGDPTPSSACAGLSRNRKMSGLAQGNHRLRVAVPRFSGDFRQVWKKSLKVSGLQSTADAKVAELVDALDLGSSG
jgi:hypothetical protein